MSTAVRRTTGLARANALLMVRNRMTLGYALVLPLLPMALLLTGSGVEGEAGVDRGMTVVASSLMMALLFPVYYNILSSLVTRRDELVLKRLRSGETRDAELVGAMVLPGVVVTLAVSLLLVLIGLALGLPFLTNPLIFLVTVVLGCAVFAALAVWTAAWTRNAEDAQVTSMPVLVLSTVGLLTAVFPESVQQYVELTPGAALTSLVELAWAGQGPDGPVGFAASWGAAGLPALTLVAWTLLAVWLAHRSMRWEPRA